MPQASRLESEPTARVQDLKSRFLALQPSMSAARAEIYYEVYREYQNYPIVLKRAIALRETLARLPVFIFPGELILGHPAAAPRAAEVFPEVNMAFMEDLDDFETREYNRLRVTPEVKASLRAMEPYWRGKTLTDHFRAARHPAAAAGVAAGLFSNSHEWTGFAHVAMDYRKLLDKGADGLLWEVEIRRKAVDPADPEYPIRAPFYQALEEICRGILIFADRHRALALETAAAETDPGRRAELERLAAVLERVPRWPAANFREALQSFWFQQLIPQIESNGFSITPGRFDQYMWPYLERDLTTGVITMDEAQELLDMLFLKFCEILRVDSTGSAEINAGYAAGQNLVVGGLDAEGRDATNHLSRLCLLSNRHVGLQQPNFTVRLHRDTPGDFLDQVVESIACGNGMPQVLNDEVIVPALVARGMPLAEARDYIPVGCDEITVHRQWGRCNGGYLNFAKVLEATLNGGRDIRHGREIGLDTKLDGANCRTFDNFLAAFDWQMMHAVLLQAGEANLTDHIHRNVMPLPFVSLFMDDCLEKGRDVTDGGAHYNTTGLVGVGAATCADSLAAIRCLTFEQGRLSLAEWREILARDFRGDEPLRQFAINRVPKFGNDDDGTDRLAVHVTNAYFDEVDRYRNYRGGAFWPALYSVSAQIGLGNHTSATPDGRLAGMPLSDGLTPMYGLDANGPTAALRSVAKIDQGRALNGVIINQRLTGSLLARPEGRRKFAALLRCFVAMKSFHWQFNIVDNETLFRAQRHPDEYRDLVVRVAGYSAIFVELSRKAQNSVIERHAGDPA